MESRRLWEVTHGQGKIEWQPHECTGTKDLSVLSTPATAWVSVALSAISAGASLYTAFKVAKIEKNIKSISNKLNIVDKKLNYVVDSLNNIEQLTETVLRTICDIQQLQLVEVFFDGARSHFEEQLRRNSLNAATISGLASDVAAVLIHANSVVRSNRKPKDILVPNWMIEKAMPVFELLRSLNIYLIEAHNYLNEYNPRVIRRYNSISDNPFYAYDDENQEQFVQLHNELIKYEQMYAETYEDKTPRKKWLCAFVWEARMAQFNLTTSRVLADEKGSKLVLPSFEIDYSLAG